MNIEFIEPLVYVQMPSGVHIKPKPQIIATDIRKKYIIQIVAKSMGLKEENIFKRCRLAEVVYARQLIYYFLYMHLRMTKSSISRMFKQDHTTVLHGMNALYNLQIENEKVRKDIKSIGKTIANGMPEAFI